MTEKQTPYVTATATPDYFTGAHVMVVSKRECEFIETWRKNGRAHAVAVDPDMAKLWDKLCRAYVDARKHNIEPVMLIDMIRLELYAANDYG